MKKKWPPEISPSVEEDIINDILIRPSNDGELIDKLNLDDQIFRAVNTITGDIFEAYKPEFKKWSGILKDDLQGSLPSPKELPEETPQEKLAKKYEGFGRFGYHFFHLSY